MTAGMDYAERLAQLCEKWVKSAKSSGEPARPDPVRQIAISILGEAEGDASGEALLEKLFSHFHDWNEVRVCTPWELSAALCADPNKLATSCHRLRASLNAIFDREDAVSLNSLSAMKVREAKEYLGRFQLGDYATASVLLWCVGAHALPLSDVEMAWLKMEGALSPEAEREQAQSFVEKHIKAVDGRSFCLALRQRAAQSNHRSAKATGRKRTSPPKETTEPS